MRNRGWEGHGQLKTSGPVPGAAALSYCQLTVGGSGVPEQPRPLISLEETRNQIWKNKNKKKPKDSRCKVLSNRSLHAGSYLSLIFISSLIIRNNTSDHMHPSSCSSHIRPLHAHASFKRPTEFHLCLPCHLDCVALGEENRFFSFWQVSIASSSSGRGGALCPPPCQNLWIDRPVCVGC